MNTSAATGALMLHICSLSWWWDMQIEAEDCGNDSDSSAASLPGLPIKQQMAPCQCRGLAAGLSHLAARIWDRQASPM